MNQIKKIICEEKKQKQIVESIMTLLEVGLSCPVRTSGWARPDVSCMYVQVKYRGEGGGNREVHALHAVCL